MMKKSAIKFIHNFIALMVILSFLVVLFVIASNFVRCCSNNYSKQINVPRCDKLIHPDMSVGSIFSEVIGEINYNGSKCKMIEIKEVIYNDVGRDIYDGNLKCYYKGFSANTKMRFLECDNGKNEINTIKYSTGKYQTEIIE